MKATKITSTTPICKNCLERLDGAIDPFGDATPKENDLSICSNCRTLAKYDKDLNLTPLTDIEIEALKRDYPKIFVELRMIVMMLDMKDGKFDNDASNMG